MRDLDGADVVFYIVVIAIAVTLTAWAYDWDWRCVIASCRILK